MREERRESLREFEIGPVKMQPGRVAVRSTGLAPARMEHYRRFYGTGRCDRQRTLAHLL